MKILLKIWPALMPILIYIFWQLVLRKISARIFTKNCRVNQGDNGRNSQENNATGGKIIDAEFCDNFRENDEKMKNSNDNKRQNLGQDFGQKTFSLSNKNFVNILYLSLILAIFCILSFAF